MKTVYLIILNCNNIDVLPALCDSITHSGEYKENVMIKFVDQGSTDGSRGYLEDFVNRHRPLSTLLLLDKNIGTTKAWNAAIKDIHRVYMAPPYYVCLINSDMKVGKNFLSPMVKIMEDNPKCGMVSNTLRDYTNIDFMQNGGPDVKNPWHYNMGFLPQDVFKSFSSQKVEWGHMGCTLFRSEVFDNIGLFDENMFIYSSDFDIQFRLKLAGYEIWFCPQSYAQHKTFVTCTELKKNPVIEEICRKDGEYLHWKWGDKVFEWFNKSKEAYDINKNLKAIYGEDFNSNEIHA